MGRSSVLCSGLLILLSASTAHASPFALQSQAPADTTETTSPDPATPASSEEATAATPAEPPPAASAEAPSAEAAPPAASADPPPPSPAAPPPPDAAATAASENSPATEPIEGPEPEVAGASSPSPEAASGGSTEAIPASTAGTDTARNATPEDTFNHHAVGFRSGLTVIPTWLLRPFAAAHTNSLCRGDTIGDFGMERGLTRNDGCNYFMGGEYVYRKSRSLDIVASAGWQKLTTPDGYWLDDDEWADGCTVADHDAGCKLWRADYTEIDLSFAYIEADFIGRATVAKGPNVEFQMGGGGGLGVGIIVGDGVYQTMMGGEVGDDGTRHPVSPGDENGTPDFTTCRTIQDLSSFQKCTPYYTDDFDIDQDGDGFVDANGDFRDPDFIPETRGPGQFADCDADGCRASDLDAFGSRFKNEDVPPAIPIVNVFVSMRMIVKDTIGFNVTGGFNTGFYFGGSLQYFFGNGSGNKKAGASQASL